MHSAVSGQRWRERTDARVLIEHLEHLEGLGVRRLPHAPWADLDGVAFQIRAVRTPRELFEEGDALRHCVFAYVEEVRSGEKAVYRALVDGRPSTACLARDDDGWYVAEHAGLGNRRPTRREREVIARWACASKPTDDGQRRS